MNCNFIKMQKMCKKLTFVLQNTFLYAQQKIFVLFGEKAECD